MRTEHTVSSANSRELAKCLGLWLAHSKEGWTHLIVAVASVLVSVPRLASFSFMWRCERWRTQKKVAGHGQRHQDEEHAEDGEQQELARLHPGLLHHGDLGQAAPLEDTHTHTGRERENMVSGQWEMLLCLCPDGWSHFWFTAAAVSGLQCISFHLKACLDFAVRKKWKLLSPNLPPPPPPPPSDRPHSLASSDTGLIMCIQTQSTPVTSPCPVLLPRCSPL